MKASSKEGQRPRRLQRRWPLRCSKRHQVRGAGQIRRWTRRKHTKKRQEFGLEMPASMNDKKEARCLDRCVCSVTTCDGLSFGPCEHQTVHHVCGICGNASCDGLSCNPYDFPTKHVGAFVHRWDATIVLDSD